MRQHEFTRDRHLLFCTSRINTSEPGSTRGVLLMAVSEFTTSPVPLYLIPQALSSEIHRFRDAITEVHIRRTSGHNYILNIHHEEPEDSHDE